MVFGFLGNNFFDNLNFGKIGSFSILGSALTNMFASQMQRQSQIQQAYQQAESLQQKVNEENFRFKILANQLDQKATKDTKQYLSGVIGAGFKLEGSALDNVVQIQNFAYEEKMFNEKIRQNVISSLEKSAYNYIRAGEKAQKYGYLEDISKIFSLGTIGYELGKKYWEKK